LFTISHAAYAYVKFNTLFYGVFVTYVMNLPYLPIIVNYA